MARLDVNRSGEMEVFVRVVELGGFSPAARAYGMTPSAVSKLIARLESRLGSRLLNRSTRGLKVTPEGCVFFERSVRLLAELDAAERAASTSEVPAGQIRVNAHMPFGAHFLLPLLPAFLERYPEIGVDVSLTDQVVDLLEERIDVAVRSGPLKNSSLVARKLGETGKRIVAAPSYLARCGVPRSPTDLETHNLLEFGYARSVVGWPLRDGDRTVLVAPKGNVRISNGDAMLRLTIGGVGLSRLATYQVDREIAAGRLVEVLADHNPGDTEPVHAVFLGHGGMLPTRVRLFLDYLAETVRM